MIEAVPQFRPLRTQEDFAAVIEAARADGASILPPSHGIWSNGDIIGTIGLNPLPLHRIWIRKGVRPRVSAEIIGMVDGVLTASGAREAFTMSNMDSPFAPLSERFGYKRLGSAFVYRKEF